MGLPEEMQLGFGLDLGSLTSGILNYFSQKETNKANRELAELAYQQNVEQWNRENMYNHPAEQMKRLQEAGLNPNLVYGKGSAVQTSAHSPQMSYPQMQAPKIDISGQGLSIQNSPLTSSQVQVNDSVIELNQAKAIESIANSKNIDSRTKSEMINQITLGARNSAALAKAQAEIELLNQQWKEVGSRIEVNKSVRDLNIEQKNKIIAELKKLNIDTKTAEALYSFWYEKGLTPGEGWQQYLIGLFNYLINPEDRSDVGKPAEPTSKLIPERYREKESNKNAGLKLGYSMGDWR